MRDDLISRQDAIDAVKHAWAKGLEPSQYIEDLPSAQPKHGRWIEENRRPKSSQFYCSECHRTAYDIQPARAKGWVKRCRYAYCPNCGAKMGGDAK